MVIAYRTEDRRFPKAQIGPGLWDLGKKAIVQPLILLFASRILNLEKTTLETSEHRLK